MTFLPFYKENDIDVSETQEAGAHHWFACSHARPTYCNVCHDALGGVTSRGLSCEVCKFKAHKRCAVYAPNNCKWVTVKMIPSERLFPDDQAREARGEKIFFLVNARFFLLSLARYEASVDSGQFACWG